MERVVDLKGGERIRLDRLMIREVVRDAAHLKREAVLFLFDLVEWCEHSERVQHDEDFDWDSFFKPARERWTAAAQAAKEKEQLWLAKRRSERQGKEIPPRAAAPPGDPPSDQADVERPPVRRRIDSVAPDQSNDDVADWSSDEEAMAARRQASWPDN
jgi:hypothetical protein